MPLNLLVGDFETFYCTKTGYTLKNSKMTTEEYIRDPRFRAHGMSFRNWATGAISWVTHDKLPYFFSKIDWNNTAFLAHHNNFDGLILSHHYGVHPRMMLCTMSMANLMAPHRYKGLEKLADWMGLSAKNVPYNLFNGIRELPPHIERAVALGCNQDVKLNYEIYEKFITGDPALDLAPFPAGELEAISIVIQMFTRPSLMIDVPRATALAQRQIERKADLLRALARVFPKYFDMGLDNQPSDVILAKHGAALRSRNNFAEILKDMGLEVPMKPSKGKYAQPGDLTQAFAKNDPGMKEMLSSDDPALVAMCEAKLSLASTITQTRAHTYVMMAGRGQPVPVYLGYAKTFSHRTGGAEKTNWGNLERLPNMINGEYEKGLDGFPKKGEIRLCVVAPPGYCLIISDLSQIEARMLATNAGQWDLVERFRDPKADPYSEFIEPFYGYPISKKTPSERGVGKQLILSCGYMAGEDTIRVTAALGSYGPPVYLTTEESVDLKKYYRGKNDKIPVYWDALDARIPTLVNGGRDTLGPLRFDNHRIWLPNDSYLDYTTLHASKAPDDAPDWKKAKPYWRMDTIGGSSVVHKGIVTAHVTSSLAQIVMADAKKKIRRESIRRGDRWRIPLTVYDEIAVLVPIEDKEEALAFCDDVMSQPPWWLPELPVACETHATLIYDK